MEVEKNRLEIIVVVQIIVDGDLDQSGDSGNGGKWLEFSCNLKMKLFWFGNRFYVGYERNRSVRVG